MLSLLLVGVTSWFAANRNPTAAAVTAGYVQRSDVYWWDVERRLEELGIDPDPAAVSSMARGAAMDGDEIVGNVLERVRGLTVVATTDNSRRGRSRMTWELPGEHSAQCCRPSNPKAGGSNPPRGAAWDFVRRQRGRVQAQRSHNG